MRDFVTKSIPAELVRCVTEDKKTPLRMDSTGPFLQSTNCLELPPIVWPLENINVGLRVTRRLLTLQLFRHHPIMELSLHRNRRNYVAADEMVDEMFGFTVFPKIAMNR